MLRVLRKLAVCHLLIAASALCFLTKHRGLAGAMWCAVGFGGLGAAWGRHTSEGSGWLDISAAAHMPDAQTVRCAAEHAPFAVAGLLTLLYWNFKH